MLRIASPFVGGLQSGRGPHRIVFADAVATCSLDELGGSAQVRRASREPLAITRPCSRRSSQAHGQGARSPEAHLARLPPKNEDSVEAALDVPRASELL